MKIIIAEKTSPAAIALFREEPGWIVITADQIKGDLPQQIVDADALVVRSAVDVNADLLQKAEKLRVIGRAGVGVDNIDLDAATHHGMVVMNTPGANAVAVAEHTFALMLALARHLSRADSTTRAGKWEKKSLQGTELRGKTLGIVGLGRIGVEVARRALAFGMRVVAHDPFVSQAIARELGISLAGLDETYAAADYLTLHVGLTPQTERMIDAAALTKMKDGVRVINCARGELIDDASLLAGLQSGKVGGAALDVFRQEPPKDNPLLSHDRVVATPHIAGSTNEAQEAVGMQIAQQVKEYLKRGVIQNAVNVPSVSDEQYAEMQPYMAMAEKLGGLLGQLSGGNLEEIQLRFSGRMAEWNTTLVRNAAIKGILQCVLSENANVVNSASLAQERGIRIQEQKKPSTSGGAAASVLTVTLKTSESTHEAKGSVMNGDSMRILALDGITIESPLNGNIICLRNRDVPGVIGKVGTVTGNHNVNIANFSLGRAEANGNVTEAIALVQVDNEVPEAVLADLRKIDAVREVKLVRL